MMVAMDGAECEGRSPHGERGLKSLPGTWCRDIEQVALLTESVD